MNVILGASGQVGSAIVDHLLTKKAPVKAVVRSPKKAADLESKGAQVAVADAFDPAALSDAFKDASTVFVLTPETGQSQDVLGDTRTILANYRAAVENSSVKRVVGLSSIGAQHAAGNLEMSYLLERAFAGSDVQTVFVRPAYFYSNWLLSLPSVKKEGVLPTFYPADLKIPMVSPQDVAAFTAETLVKPIEGSSTIYELEGPEWYSSTNVADTLGDVLGRDVEVRETPRESWATVLQGVGYTPDAGRNFIAMTELVAAGQATPEGQGVVSAKSETTLRKYLMNSVAD